MTGQTNTLRRRTNDPEGMRRRILETSAQLFQSRGYANTAMQDISREAGVTGGGMHHHFPTKKSLALAVIDERVRATVEETWIAPVLKAETVQRGVARVFHDIEDGLAAAGRVNGCPLNNLALELAAIDPDIRVAIGDVFTQWKAALVRAIHRDQQEGRLSSHSADDLATFIIASYSGAMSMAKVQQSAAPLAICRAELTANLAD